MRKLSLTAIGSLHIYGNYVSYKRLRTTNTNFTFEVPLCLLNKLVSPKHLLHIYFNKNLQLHVQILKPGCILQQKAIYLCDQNTTTPDACQIFRPLTITANSFSFQLFFSNFGGRFK